MSEETGVGPDAIGERLSAAFQCIHETRMRGLPILNERLQVQVVGGRMHQGDWWGVLITPWCMNLVRVPGPDSLLPPPAQGVKQETGLPSGPIELIGSEESGVGPFAASSIFSPMGDFADHASAVATADAVLELLFAAPAQATGGSSGAGGGGRGLSRRDLLRGAIRRS